MHYIDTLHAFFLEKQLDLHNLTELKWEIYSTIIIVDFNIPLSEMDRTTQEIKHEI